MILKRVYFECIIPEINKKAYYDLIAGHDLFGYIIQRRWGRIGTKGKPRMKQRFRNKEEMLVEFEKIHSTRLKRNYVPVKKADIFMS